MEPKQKSLTLALFSWSALGALASLIVWVVWSLLYPFEMFSSTPDSWVVQNPGKRVARGQELKVYLDYCATSRRAPRMDTLIEQDGRIMLLETQYPKAAIGCHKSVVPLAKIPRIMAIESTSAGGTGAARVQITLRYRINALREIQYNYTTDDFIIDP